MYKNTDVTYLESGEKKYGILLDELKKAKNFIFLEYFIIEQGEVWDSVLEVLCEKIRKLGIKSKPFAPARPFLQHSRITEIIERFWLLTVKLLLQVE